MLSAPKPGMTIEEQVEIAKAYVQRIADGGIDERYIAADMTAWSLTMRKVPRSRYWPRLANVKAIFMTPLTVTVDRTTAEQDCVVVQARSKGVLFTGDLYSNDYLFQIEFDKAGCICHVREYFDVEKLKEVLMPALLRFEHERSTLMLIDQTLGGRVERG